MQIRASADGEGAALEIDPHDLLVPRVALLENLGNDALLVLRVGLLEDLDGDALLALRVGLLDDALLPQEGGPPAVVTHIATDIVRPNSTVLALYLDCRLPQDLHHIRAGTSGHRDFHIAKSWTWNIGTSAWNLGTSGLPHCEELLLPRAILAAQTGNQECRVVPVHRHGGLSERDGSGNVPRHDHTSAAPAVVRVDVPMLPEPCKVEQSPRQVSRVPNQM